MDAKELKQIRVEMGLGQTALAKLLNTPLRSYINWERGQCRVPGMVEVALRAVRSEVEVVKKDVVG